MRFELQALLIASTAMLGSSALANPPAPSVRVDAAWIRWLPAGVPAGGYATLTNFGEKPAVLTAAASVVFNNISIHRTVRRGSISQMESVSEIVINPHSTLDFESMGYHLMLLEPTESLENSTNVDLTLSFKDGGSISAPFQIRKVGAAAPVAAAPGASAPGASAPGASAPGASR
jgi:periplasmic copper chaperone A